MTIIIVDKTDLLSAAEQQRLRNVIVKERDALAQGAKIVVSALEQTVGSEGVALKPVLALCNPGSEANPLFENPKRVMARYTQSFAEPLDQAMESATTSGSAPSSPIANALNAAIAEHGGGPLAKRRLVLVSDLMEHSPQGSAYDGSLSSGTLVKLIDAKSQAWLKSAEIEIHLLKRHGHGVRQTAAQSVWLDFFRMTGTAPPFTLQNW